MQLTQQTKITQTTALSVRQQQSLKLLAMNSLALNDAIEQELESNPTLEKADNQPGDEVFPGESDGSTSEANDPLGDLGWPAYRDNAPSYSRFTESTDSDNAIDNQAAPGESLSEHLIRQLEVICEDEADFEIAAEIATSLDGDGYLRLSTEYLAEEIGVFVESVERILTGVVQSLDPPGVAARDLRECLLIQWRSSNDKQPLVGEVIERHLNEIGKKASAQIAEKLGVTVNELNEALTTLRSYEPIPGRAFGTTDSEVLVPDTKVELIGGEVDVSLISDNIPRLRLSRYYRKMLENPKELETSARRYLNEKIRASAWFIRAIHQRRKTIEKVTYSVFERQRGFLSDGTSGLKPLTMDEVAEDIEMHVSTVSRAVADKIVETPRGLLPLKFFFTGSLPGDGGEVATERVKSLIRSIIADEDTANPLSDEAIVDRLKTEGVELARRTIAKYRKELTIPSKYERKKYL